MKRVIYDHRPHNLARMGDLNISFQEDKWFERLTQLHSFLKTHNRLPSPCSQLGRWLNLQIKAFNVDLESCKGPLQIPSIYKAFYLLRQEYFFLFMTEREQWENTFFSKFLREVLGF